MRVVADLCITKIKALRPDSDVINDISGFRPSTSKGVYEMERSMRFTVDNRVRHIIQVIKPYTIARLQIPRMVKKQVSVLLLRKPSCLMKRSESLTD